MIIENDFIREYNKLHILVKFKNKYASNDCSVR